MTTGSQKSSPALCGSLTIAARRDKATPREGRVARSQGWAQGSAELPAEYDKVRLEDGGCENVLTLSYREKYIYRYS